MSRVISGNHFKLEELAEALEDCAEIIYELDCFSEWIEKTKFDSLSKGVEKCRVKDRDHKGQANIKEARIREQGS